MLRIKSGAVKVLKVVAAICLVLVIIGICGSIISEAQKAHQKPAAPKAESAKVENIIAVDMEHKVSEGEPDHLYCDVCGKDMRSKDLDITVQGMSIRIDNIKADDDKTYEQRKAFLQKQLGEYEIGRTYHVCWECMLKATGITPRWTKLTPGDIVWSTDNTIDNGGTALLTFEASPNYVWALHDDTIITVVARENKSKAGVCYEPRTPDRIEINGDYVNYQHFDSDRNLIVIGIREKKR